MSDVTDRLVVRGAREHNLRNISLELPRDALIVFTGLSGSGKSSLAFDTIFAEGQRRYVESLSAYARQFLGQMDKPDVDFIEGLSPAVSIDQKSTSRNPRSTVGTITEVYDYLRLLYARAGRPHCPICGEPISRQSPQQIVDRLLALPEGTRFQILAPVVRGRKGEYVEVFRQLAAEGFSRARVDGEIIAADRSAGAGQEVQAHHRRGRGPAGGQADGQAAADRLGRDRARTGPGRGDRSTSSTSTPRTRCGSGSYSEKMACPNDHDIAIDELEPRQFSFNGPVGRLPGVLTAWARGWRSTPSWSCRTTTRPWPRARSRRGRRLRWPTTSYRLIESLAESAGFSTTVPWHKLPAAAKQMLLHGVPGQVHVRYRNRYGRERSYNAKYEGVVSYIERRHAEAESDTSRERFAGYMREVPCRACKGARLKPTSLAVTIGEQATSPRSRPCRSTRPQPSCGSWSSPTGSGRSPSGCSRRSTNG